MRKIYIVLFFLFLNGVAISQTVSVPILKKRVTDLTNTLSKEQLNFLEQILTDFENDNGSQVAVLMLPSTGNESIEEFSIRVAEEWEIGREEYDDGVILLIAKNDRELRIEVGYGLESVITDANASIIINDYIVPSFKEGNFYSGIYNGINQIIFLIEGGTYEYSSSDLDYLYDDEAEEEYSPAFLTNHPTLLVLTIIIGICLPIVFVFVSKVKLWIIILLLLICIGLNLLAGIGMGDIMFSLGFLINTVVFGIMAILMKIWGVKGGGGSSTYRGSNYSSSNYSSSSSYSSFGSSSSGYSSGSSYSGGGGGFGGGGASGSW